MTRGIDQHNDFRRAEVHLPLQTIHLLALGTIGKHLPAASFRFSCIDNRRDDELHSKGQTSEKTDEKQEPVNSNSSSGGSIDTRVLHSRRPPASQ